MEHCKFEGHRYYIGLLKQCHDDQILVSAVAHSKLCQLVISYGHIQDYFDRPRVALPLFALLGFALCLLTFFFDIDARAQPDMDVPTCIGSADVTRRNPDGGVSYKAGRCGSHWKYQGPIHPPTRVICLRSGRAISLWRMIRFR